MLLLLQWLHAGCDRHLTWSTCCLPHVLWFFSLKNILRFFSFYFFLWSFIFSSSFFNLGTGPQRHKVWPWVSRWAIFQGKKRKTKEKKVWGARCAVCVEARGSGGLAVENGRERGDRTIDAWRQSLGWCMQALFSFTFVQICWHCCAGCRWYGVHSMVSLFSKNNWKYGVTGLASKSNSVLPLQFKSVEITWGSIN